MSGDPEGDSARTTSAHGDENPSGDDRTSRSEDENWPIDRRTLLLGLPAAGIAAAGCYAGWQTIGDGSSGNGDATTTETTPFGYGGTPRTEADGETTDAVAAGPSDGDAESTADAGEETTPVAGVVTETTTRTGTATTEGSSERNTPTRSGTATETQTETATPTETPGDYGIQGYGEYGYGGVFP